MNDRYEEAREFADIMMLDEGIVSGLASAAGKVAGAFNKMGQGFKNNLAQNNAAISTGLNKAKAAFSKNAKTDATNDLTQLTKAENNLVYAIEKAIEKNPPKEEERQEDNEAEAEDKSENSESEDENDEMASKMQEALEYVSI